MASLYLNNDFIIFKNNQKRFPAKNVKKFEKKLKKTILCNNTNKKKKLFEIINI